jgi:hypothetical protein
MDRIDDLPGRIFEHPWWPDPTNLNLRRELGAIRRVADSIDMNTAIPANNAASSGYCLASPDGARVAVASGQVQLQTLAGRFEIVWRDISRGQTSPARQETIAGGATMLRSPFGDSAVAVILRPIA